MLRTKSFYLFCFGSALSQFFYLSEGTNRIIFPGTVNSNSSRDSPSLTEFREEDPCVPYNSRTPDFSRPGRRISSVKCYEYVWQMKDRSVKAERKSKYDRVNNPGIPINKPVKQVLGGKATLRGEFPNIIKPNNRHQIIVLTGVLRKAISSSNIEKQRPALYVLGGHNVVREEFPNMGAIGWKAVVGTWVFMCGSSLISPKFVLTAAHCSSASSRDTTIADVVPKIVRLGDKSILDSSYTAGKKSNDANIMRIIVHPKYKSPKCYFDIALMELATEVKFSSELQPACLWTEPEILKYGSHAQIAGWGVVKSGSRDMSPELLAADVDIVDTEHCQKLLMPNCNRNWCGLRDQICAGKLAGGVDSCQGDSGGPLQVKVPLPITTEGSMYYLIGVTSFGIGCGMPNVPGVYTKVSSFVDWIEKIVWK